MRYFGDLKIFSVNATSDRPCVKIEVDGQVAPARCHIRKGYKRIICNCKIISHHNLEVITKWLNFLALQLICFLPNDILNNTIIIDDNTTAGPNGEMLEGETIRYVVS